MSWKELKEKDHREWKLSSVDPHDKEHLVIWCEIYQAWSYPATWRWPTVVEDAPEC